MDPYYTIWKELGSLAWKIKVVQQYDLHNPHLKVFIMHTFFMHIHSTKGEDAYSKLHMHLVEAKGAYALKMRYF